MLIKDQSGSKTIRFFIWGPFQKKCRPAIYAERQGQNIGQAKNLLDPRNTSSSTGERVRVKEAQ
jgi:hypothetical protein